MGSRRAGLAAAVLLCGFLLLSGCSSTRTTLLERDESNLRWRRERHLHGIPITLKVPTHLKVMIVEKHFLEEVDGHVRPVPLPFCVRDFRHELIYTDKIFTVDFLRPAAGEFDLGLEFNDQQYFRKVQHEVVDRTIQDVTELVASLAPEGLIGSPLAARTGPLADLAEVESVVAVTVLEIDEPDFEEQLTGFIQCHLNGPSVPY